MTITINPVITSNAAGTFSVTLDGMIQGMAMDDPAIRYQLTGGQLAPTETLPMFGGIPIAEFIPPTGTLMERALQNFIERASSTVAPTGISVFNQNHAMINSPESNVPQASNGMLVNFYRFGSRARIAMAMDPAYPIIVAAPGFPVIGGATPVNYNTTLGWITSAAVAAGIIALPGVRVIDFNIGNSMTVTFNNTPTGFANWNRQGSTILLEI